MPFGQGADDFCAEAGPEIRELCEGLSRNPGIE